MSTWSWRTWTSCPQVPPTSFSSARLTWPILKGFQTPVILSSITSEEEVLHSWKSHPWHGAQVRTTNNDIATIDGERTVDHEGTLSVSVQKLRISVMDVAGQPWSSCNLHRMTSVQIVQLSRAPCQLHQHLETSSLNAHGQARMRHRADLIDCPPLCHCNCFSCS